jgi:hypothetical protein
MKKRDFPTLTIRLDPRVRDVLVTKAEQDQRSAAFMAEKLIMERMRDLGWLADEKS